MASTASDVIAGKSYIQLYVRDHLFKRQLAEDQQLFQESFADQGQQAIGDSSDGYGQMADSADGAMELIYTNTMHLVDATELLNDALESVMESYLGLADMQQEGITLNAEMPQQARIEGSGGGEQQGGDSAAKGMIRGFGTALGEHLTSRFIESDFVQGKLVDPLIARIGSVTEKAAATMRIAERAAASMGTSQFGAAPLGLPAPSAQLALPAPVEAMPQMADLVKTSTDITSASAAFAELTPRATESAKAIASVIPPSNAVSRAIDSASAAATRASTAVGSVGQSAVGMADSMISSTARPFIETATYAGDVAADTAKKIGGVGMAAAGMADTMISATARPFIDTAKWAGDAAQTAAKHIGAVGSAALRMGDQMVSATARPFIMTAQAIGDAAKPATDSIKSIGRAIFGTAPAAPIMAELAEATNEAGVYMAQLVPETNSATAATVAMAGSSKAAAVGTSLFSKVIHGLRAAFVGLMISTIVLIGVIVAVTAAFYAFKVAVAILTLPFTLLKKALDLTVFAIQKIATYAVAAVGWLYRMGQAAAFATVRMAKFAASTVWSGAVGTFNAVEGAIRGVGSALQTAGKWTAILGGGMTALGALVIGPLTKAAQMFQEQGEKIDKLAKGYKLTAEAASVYSYIAGQMNKSVGERGGQSGGGARMMEGRIDKIKDTIKEGTPEFEKWRQQAAASGMVMGGPAVEAALALDDAFDRLRDGLHGLWVTMGQAVAPIIVDMTETLVGAVRGVITYVKQNQALIATAFRVAKVVATVGTVVAALGSALFTIGAAISPLTVALAALAGGLAIIEYRTSVGRSLWASYKDSVVGIYNTMVKNLMPVVAFVKRIMDGVIDAVKGGDLALAARVAWGGLKIAWIEGLMWLSERTTGAFSGILANLAAGRWKAAADGAMGMIEAAWLRTKQVVFDVWGEIVYNTLSAWTNIVNAADTGVTNLQNAVAPTWERISDGAQDVWDTVKVAFEGMVQIFDIFVASLKNVGQNVLDWIVKPLALAAGAKSQMAVGLASLLGEMAVSSGKGVGADFAGAISSQIDVVKQKFKTSKPGELSKADNERLAKEATDRDLASAERIAGRKRTFAEEQMARDMFAVGRRMEITQQIAAAEARGAAAGPGTPGAMNAKSEIAALRLELAQNEAAAALAKSKLVQPPGVDLPGTGKGGSFITTSAYAFGGTGGTSVPQQQLTKAQETYKLLNDIKKDFQSVNLAEWLKANPKIPDPQVFGNA